MDSVEEQLDHLMHIDCPRCGYDMRGVIASWRESCPLEGICSECGLLVSWGEILSPERYPPEWSVEHAPKRRLIHAAIMTLLRSLCPWLVWRSLRMIHEIKPRRLVFHAMFQLFPLITAYAVIQGSAAWHVRRTVGENLQAQHTQQMKQIEDLQNRLDELRKQPPDDYETGYLSNIIAVDEALLAELRMNTQAGSIVSHSYVRAIAEAILLPLSTQSYGRSWNSERYPPPGSVLRRWLPSVSSNWRASHETDLKGVALFWALTAAIAIWFPVGYSLLILTRRRLRIRKRHFARIAVYSAFIPVVVAFVVGWMYVRGIRNPNEYLRMQRLSIQIALYATPALTFAWWLLASWLYLRIPRPWLVTGLVGSAGILLAVVPLAMLTRHAWFD